DDRSGERQGTLTRQQRGDAPQVRGYSGARFTRRNDPRRGVLRFRNRRKRLCPGDRRIPPARGSGGTGSDRAGRAAQQNRCANNELERDSNASEQETRASVLTPSGPIVLWTFRSIHPGGNEMNRYSVVRWIGAGVLAAGISCGSSVAATKIKLGYSAAAAFANAFVAADEGIFARHGL